MPQRDHEPLHHEASCAEPLPLRGTSESSCHKSLNSGSFSTPPPDFSSVAAASLTSADSASAFAGGGAASASTALESRKRRLERQQALMGNSRPEKQPLSSSCNSSPTPRDAASAGAGGGAGALNSFVSTDLLLGSWQQQQQQLEQQSHPQLHPVNADQDLISSKMQSSTVKPRPTRARRQLMNLSTMHQQSQEPQHKQEPKNPFAPPPGMPLLSPVLTAPPAGPAFSQSTWTKMAKRFEFLPSKSQEQMFSSRPSSSNSSDVSMSSTPATGSSSLFSSFSATQPQASTTHGNGRTSSSVAHSSEVSQESGEDTGGASEEKYFRDRESSRRKMECLSLDSGEFPTNEDQGHGEDNHETSTMMVDTLDECTVHNSTTQTLEESASVCVMRFLLHPKVEKRLPLKDIEALKRANLYRLELSFLNSRIVLGRDNFTSVFGRKNKLMQTLKLSRVHCVLECHASRQDSRRLCAYVTDKSANGTRVDGRALDKNMAMALSHGQTITLLSTRGGEVALGYVVEDPHVIGAQIPDKMTLSTQDEDDSEFKEDSTLGVLFSAPIVGKDIHGKYHPIAELDIKSEYSILQQSLTEALTTAAVQPAVDGKCIRRPQPIHVRARFANSETFRSLVTLGCRALHFSGHGDEKFLYFEDGMGLVHPIPHNELRDLFVAGGDRTSLRLAFVSACSSAPLAHAFVSCGIPHVIGVKINQKIEDQAAIEFTRSFYLALAIGKTVEQSFAIAKQAVSKSPNIRGPVEVAEKFMLLPENSDHSEVIFPLVAGPEADKAVAAARNRPQRFPTLWFDDLPAICQGFCNRHEDVYKICLALMLKQSRVTRLVNIRGEEGIGKTAVAYAVARYVGPRMTWRGGVKFFYVTKIAEEEYQQQSRVQDSDSRPPDLITHDEVAQVSMRLGTLINEYLDQNRKNIEMHHDKNFLIILDGCDYLLRTSLSRQRFRHFVSDLLTMNPSLKMMLTARNAISSDGSVPGHGERVYSLARFNAKMSAKLLLSLVSRPIHLEEIQKSLANASSDKLDKLTNHPALIATQGIPKRIADLAGKLNDCLMDDIC